MKNSSLEKNFFFWDFFFFFEEFFIGFFSAETLPKILAAGLTKFSKNKIVCFCQWCGVLREVKKNRRGKFFF